MNIAEAIGYARVLATKPPEQRTRTEAALIALLEHGDKVEIPDLETAVRMVAAQIHARGKYYIEIAIDPETKEVGHTFEPTLPDKTGQN